MNILVPTWDILVAWMGSFHLKDEQFEVIEFTQHSGIHKSQTLSPMAPAFSARLGLREGFARCLRNSRPCLEGLVLRQLMVSHGFSINHNHPWTLEQRLICFTPPNFYPQTLRMMIAKSGISSSRGKKTPFSGSMIVFWGVYVLIHSRIFRVRRPHTIHGPDAERFGPFSFVGKEKAKILGFTLVMAIPNTQCMVYLLTFTIESNQIAGRYTIHSVSGHGSKIVQIYPIICVINKNMLWFQSVGVLALMVPNYKWPYKWSYTPISGVIPLSVGTCIQGGHLLVMNWVITPINGLIDG